MEWCQSLKIVFAGVVAVGLSGLLTGCETTVERYRNEGVRLYKAQQYDESAAALKQALAANQSDAVSNAYTGLIELRADQLAQAEYHFRLALDIDPSSEEAKSGLASALIKQGKAGQALDALERAAKMAEGVQDPRGDKSNIKVPYTKQVEERLFLGQVKDRLRIAKIYESLGDYDNALVYYKKALDKRDDTSTMMEIVAMAERAKNPALAREYLVMAYRKDPGTPGLVSAMTRNGLAISQVIATAAPSK
jgi:tetratricopeptide (TPR) repeat protein